MAARSAAVKRGLVASARVTTLRPSTHAVVIAPDIGPTIAGNPPPGTPIGGRAIGAIRAVVASTAMKPDPEALEARVVDLELRYMKLERYAHDLSSVVADQQRLLDALTAETKRLRERALDEGHDVAPAEKPPHY